MTYIKLFWIIAAPLIISTYALIFIALGILLRKLNYFNGLGADKILLFIPVLFPTEQATEIINTNTFLKADKRLQKYILAIKIYKPIAILSAIVLIVLIFMTFFA